uniref:Uncharacterized protein LOC114341894 n=1 Tax=Diabrotica virgifera virgifera TaxID=50390 RepID=A0A6P7GR32_DIAVI
MFLDPLAEPDNNEESGEEYTFYTPFKFEPDPRGLGNYLFNRMKKHRHHIAQYIADTDEEQTYAELLQRCVRTACHLSTRSLTKDDVVVLCSYNHKESSVPFIASLFLNVPVASMDPTLSLMESAYLLKDVRPKIIFVVPEGLELMETSVKQAGIIIGGAKVTVQKMDPHETWKLIDKYKVTTLFVPPLLATAVLKVGRPEGLDISSFRNFIIVGGYCPKSLLLDLRDLLPGTFVSSSYGLTEVSGALTVFKTSSCEEVKERLYLQSKPTSVGLIIPGIKAKVVNLDTGKTCGPNEGGELRIKSEFLMNGYHNQDTSDS